MALLRRKLVLAVLVAFILTLLVILVLALLILLVAILVVVLVLAVVLVLVLIVAHDFTPFCSYYDPGIKFLYKGERMMERLPKEFLSVMEPLLGGNYSDFIQSFLQPPYRAVRLNPLKITAEKAAAVLPFRLSPAPFCSESYYIDPAAQGVGSHPLHHAGAYYVQEPSAAGAVTVLDPKPGDRVLDLCAGTGCLGLGIKRFCPAAQVTCVEKSPQALQYLQANVHGTGVQAKAADVLQYWRELMPQSVQLIISNPPYLTGAEMQALMPETAHEPAMALDGGTDGLDFYRAIAAHYRDIVCPGGWLVFEIGCAQRADVMEICRQNGWQQVQARKDYGGNDRVVYAQRVK